MLLFSEWDWLGAERSLREAVAIAEDSLLLRLDLGGELPCVLFRRSNTCSVLLREFVRLLEGLSGSQILLVEPHPIGDQVSLPITAASPLSSKAAPST